MPQTSTLRRGMRSCLCYFFIMWIVECVMVSLSVLRREMRYSQCKSEGDKLKDVPSRETANQATTAEMHVPVVLY